MPSIESVIDGAIQWLYVGNFTNMLSSYIWQPSSGSCCYG